MIRHYIFVKYVNEILRRGALKVGYEIGVLRQSVCDNYNGIVDDFRHWLSE
jgi:hypothetical protein